MKRMKQLCGFALVAGALLLSAGEIKVFPADYQKGNFSLNEGFAAPLKVTFIDDGNAWLKDGAKLFVETVPGVPVIAAASLRHDSHLSMKVTVDGGKSTIELPEEFVRKMVKTAPPWRSFFNLYFRAAKGTAGKRFPVTLTVAGKSKTFLTKKMFFTVVPELPKSIPMQKLSTGHWNFHSMYLPKEHEDLFQENMAFWKGLCAKPATAIGNVHFTLPANRFKEITDSFEHGYLMHSCLDTPTVVGTNYGFFDRNHDVSRPGVPRLVRFDGTTWKGAICPWYMRKDPEKLFWDSHIKEGLQSVMSRLPKASYIMVDYESFPNDGLCENCRKEFAAQEKLAKIPSAKEVAPGTPLYMKWRYYRARTRNEIVKRLGDVVHKYFPGMKYRMCTVTLLPDKSSINAWSGLDVKGMDSLVDEFENMHYSSGKHFFNTLEYNLKELKKPQRILIDPAEDIFRYYNRYTPDKVRQNILATYAMGCKNITLYPTDYYDAAYLTMLVRAFNASAQAEKAYLKGALKTGLVCTPKNVSTITLPDGKTQKTLTIPDFSSDFRSFLHSDGESDYVTLFNFSENSSVFAEIAIPEFGKSGSAVTDLLTGTVYKDITKEMIRKGFLVELPKNGTLLLKIGGCAEEEHAVSQKSLRDALERELKVAEKNLQNFGTVTDNKNRSISYVISKGSPVLQLKIGNAVLKCSPGKSGSIAGWKVPAVGELIENSRGKRLGDLIIREELGTVPADVPYTVTDRKLTSSGVEVTMEYTVPADRDAGGSGNPLEGLKIIRKIGVHSYWGGFSITHTFVNTSKKNMKLAFRLRNLPVYRWKQKDGKETILSNGKPLEMGTHCYLLKGKPNTWNILENPVEMDDLSVHYNVGFLRFHAAFPEFTGLYCWADGLMQTVEPTSPEFVLKPGEQTSFTMKVDIINVGKKK